MPAILRIHGFRGSQLRELHSLIAEQRREFIVAWDEHFSQ